MTVRMVGDCLSRAVASIGAGQSLTDAMEVVRARRMDTLVVLDGERAVGVITADAIADAWPSVTTSFTFGEVAERLDATRVTAAMSHDVVSVTPRTPLVEAARLMRWYGLGVLPVVVGDVVVGTVTIWDVLAVLGPAGVFKTSP